MVYTVYIVSYSLDTISLAICRFEEVTCNIIINMRSHHGKGLCIRTVACPLQHAGEGSERLRGELMDQLSGREHALDRSCPRAVRLVES